jgi:ADP-ribose pyrophosphatase YjhB (NUDIX family)
MSTWKRRFEPVVRPAIRGWARARRGMTLGVRAVVTDDAGQVLLIEHTYVAGWHLPGGGVERGQGAEQAVAKELVEEAGVQLTDRPTLVSVHDNGRLYPGDHVLVYRVGAWVPCPATSRGEIREAAFFPLDALPETTTRATRQRLAEVFAGEAPDPWW